MKNYKKPYIIFALSLSLIEIFIGIPRSFSVTEIVVGLALLLILYVPGIYTLFLLKIEHGIKLLKSFIKVKKSKDKCSCELNLLHNL